MRRAFLLLLLLALPAAAQPQPPLPVPPVPPPVPPRLAAPAPAAARPPVLAPPMPTARPEHPPERPDDGAKGPMSGLPMPRFAATRSEEVNIRTGPGSRYPVEWVLKRRDMPVEIIREHDVWRRVRDWQGTEGWVQTNLLTGRRNFVVVGQEAVLHRRADSASDALARLGIGVIGRIRSCEGGSPWCQVQVATPSGSLRGWLPRSAFWGSYRGEAVN